MRFSYHTCNMQLPGLHLYRYVKAELFLSLLLRLLRRYRGGLLTL